MDSDIAEIAGIDDAREQFWTLVPMSPKMSADRVEEGLGRHMTRQERLYYVIGYTERLGSLAEWWGEQPRGVEYRAVVSCG